MFPANTNFTDDFLRAHPVTAGWEGGWSNHKADPGGKTMYGVTEAKWFEWLDRHGFKRRPVRSITKGEALQLYYEEFWLKAGCESLFPGVDLAVYDASVNSGVGRGRKWLLASLDKQNRHDRTVKAICAARLGFVQTLKHWRDFGRGWSNRIADIEAKGVAWALAAMHDRQSVAEQLRDEAGERAAIARKQGAGAAGAGVGGAGAVVVEVPADPASAVEPALQMGPQLADWMLTGLGLTLFGVAAWLVCRAMFSSQQARAYSSEAETFNA